MATLRGGAIEKVATEWSHQLQVPNWDGTYGNPIDDGSMEFRLRSLNRYGATGTRHTAEAVGTTVAKGGATSAPIAELTRMIDQETEKLDQIRGA